MFDLDSRLLQIFFEIYQQESVTKAAETLHIGQPTLSIALNKLREHFQDPLFIRIENKMQPTAFAQEIYPLVFDALKNLRYLQNYSQKFDPLTTVHHYKICMTDISHLTLLPRLLAYLDQNAPNISIEIQPITSNTAAQLLNGEIDFVIGFIPQLEAGIYQQKLFDQHYVGICAEQHPRLKKPIQLDALQKESFIDIKATGGHLALQNELKHLNIQRKVTLTLPSYLGAAELVKSTDHVAIVPYFLALYFIKSRQIQILDLPFNLPQYSIMQHWHHRNHKRLAHQWLRNVCFELFSDLDIFTAP